MKDVLKVSVIFIILNHPTILKFSGALLNGNSIRCNKPKHLIVNVLRSYCSVNCDSKNNVSDGKVTSNVEANGAIYSVKQAQKIEHIHKLYPTPRLTLNNMFSVVADQLHNKDLKLKPEFKLINHVKNRSSWMCTYHLQWPEPKTFSSTSSSKQEAAHKAALQAITWLKLSNKIDNQGRPLIFGREEIKKIKDPSPEFVLDKAVEEKLCDIIEKYELNLSSSFEKIKDIKCDTLEETSKSDLKRHEELNETIRMPFQQRFEGVDVYLRDSSIQLPILKQRFVLLCYFYLHLSKIC